MNNLTLDRNIRLRAMWCHLINLTIWIIPFPLVFILAIILYRLNPHPFVTASGKEALNFSASILLYMLLIFTIVLATCGTKVIDLSILLGAGLILVLIITHIILVIFGSVRASKGISYLYPLAIRFLNN
jgi:uncharacterized Tic20 family protein